jgi:outer membrane protein
MMTRLALSAIFSVMLAASAMSQQVAIVDVAAVLESMTDYTAAQQELDRIAAAWNQEIAQEYDKIKSMYNKYQAEQVLLSDDLKKQREEEIMVKEKQVRELQREKFGPEGQLFDKRQQLVAPVQDRVYAAIQSYADERGIDIVLDKSSASGIIFANERYDKTEDIKKKMGL